MIFAIVGYGRMGKKVEAALNQRGEAVACIVDPDLGYSWRDFPRQGVDCAICFTTPEAGYETTKGLLANGIDTVLATTDFYLNRDNTINREMMNEFENLAQDNECRMVYAPNFAIGMQKFMGIVSMVAQELSELGYDVGISEWHHANKQDVSGTAKKLAEIIMEKMPHKQNINAGDCQRKREDSEITIGSVRAGHIPGTHSIVFDSLVDTIELTHRVRDPNIFAHGAIEAAYVLRNLVCDGVYSLDQIIK